MIFEIYYENSIYNLDKQRGKGKIYEIINKSKPIQIKNLFSEESFAHVPSGSYYFYINGYTLALAWTLNDIYRIFELLERIIKDNKNLLFTINYEGPCSYVVALPQEDNTVRLVFLDRIEPECRDWENRYRDNELKNTIAVKDIIISKYELIKQFNDEFKRIYEENKYYLSEEYKEKCKANNEVVCQEYVLETFKDYIPIFDKYLENPEKFWEDSFFNIKTWNAKTNKTVSELKKYFYKLKENNIFIGSKIGKIMVLSRILNDDRGYFKFKKGKWYERVFDSRKNKIIYKEDAQGPIFDSKRTENVSLTIDEPLSIFIVPDEGCENHFDIDFTKTGRFMMKPNSFDFWEKSGKSDEDWKDVSKYFSKNIVGCKIVDVNIEAYSNDDEDIDLVEFVLDNGYKLSLETDLMSGYMSLSEEKE